MNRTNSNPRVRYVLLGDDSFKLQRGKAFYVSKVVNYVINIIYLALAATFIVLAVWAAKSFGDFLELSEIPIPYIMIGFGIFLCILAILAMVGLKRPSTRLVTFALVMLILLTLGEFIAGGYTFYYGQHTIDRQFLENRWRDLKSSEKASVEQQYSCCGWRNATDSPSESCLNTTFNGCMTKVEPAFDTFMDEVGTVFTIFAAFQIVGIVSGFVVLRVLRKEKREQNDQYVMFTKNVLFNNKTADIN